MSSPDLHSTVVSALLAAKPKLGRPAEQIDEATPIGTAGLGINSLGLLQALVTLEAKLGIVFDDRSVAEAHFDTVGALVAFVRQTLAMTESDASHA